MTCKTPTTPLHLLRINLGPFISHSEDKHFSDLLHTSELLNDYNNSPDSTLSKTGNSGRETEPVVDDLPNNGHLGHPDKSLHGTRHSDQQFDETDFLYTTGNSCGIKRQNGNDDLSYNDGFENMDKITHGLEDDENFNERTINSDFSHCGRKRHRGEWSDIDGCKCMSKSSHRKMGEYHPQQDTDNPPLLLHTNFHERNSQHKLTTSSQTHDFRECTCECSCDGYGDVSTVYHLEENTSEIFIKSAKEKKNAGFSVTTDKSSHRISNVSKLLFPDLDFHENDRIVAIQKMSVEHWEHQILRDFLCHLFDPDIKTFTMILQRGNEFKEITIELVEIDSEFTELSVRVKRMITYKIQRPFVRVRLVEYLGDKLCTISHRITNNDKRYLRIDDKGKLTLDHYSLDDEKSYRFQLVQYRGIQRCNNQPEGVLFCRFISVLTERCLTIKGLTKVGLVDSSREDRNSMKALTTPDPRYFKCNRTTEDRTERTIESLVHPGLFVTVDPRKGKIVLSDTNVQGDSLFQIKYQ